MAGDGRTPDASSPAVQGSDSHAAMVARARALIPELREILPAARLSARFDPRAGSGILEKSEKRGPAPTLISLLQGASPRAHIVPPV